MTKVTEKRMCDCGREIEYEDATECEECEWEAQVECPGCCEYYNPEDGESDFVFVSLDFARHGLMVPGVYKWDGSGPFYADGMIEFRVMSSPLLFVAGIEGDADRLAGMLCPECGKNHEAAYSERYTGTAKENRATSRDAAKAYLIAHPDSAKDLEYALYEADRFRERIGLPESIVCHNDWVAFSVCGRTFYHVWGDHGEARQGSVPYAGQQNADWDARRYWRGPTLEKDASWYVEDASPDMRYERNGYYSERRMFSICSFSDACSVVRGRKPWRDLEWNEHSYRRYWGYPLGFALQVLERAIETGEYDRVTLNPRKRCCGFV